MSITNTVNENRNDAQGIDISGLSFSYDGRKPALRDITLEIRPGERFGIIGPSGAGKSTLLLHLNGILMGHRGSVKIGETLNS